MILLDTHVILWVTEDTSNVANRVFTLVDEAAAQGNLLVSAISFWEVAVLIGKGRIRQHLDASAWRLRVLNFGFREIPVDGEIAVLAGAGLAGFHSDPADRIIAASAMLHHATLVTADKAILRWARRATPRVDTLNARSGRATRAASP